jgi:hypothetical protein
VDLLALKVQLDQIDENSLQGCDKGGRGREASDVLESLKKRNGDVAAPAERKNGR